ncbi:GATA type transcriptional activator [Collariella sp. IMI 366227]|nr:GATA type transcriptional activator [Collariella sp. IMI 366227]
MKKSIIKRRKRLDTESTASERAESPLSEVESPKEKGSVNPDGSVNLGFRRRQERPMTMVPTLVPETTLRQTRQASPLSNDLGQYHSSQPTQAHFIPDSLTNENRLAPMMSIPMPHDRQMSLSPASFLSPSRKRSFSAADMEQNQNDDPPKRLSSIKSILNPTTATSPGPEDLPEQTQQIFMTPTSTAASTPSPGAYPAMMALPAPQQPQRQMGMDVERARAEKRAALERERQMMRELLAAKDREIAELGGL